MTRRFYSTKVEGLAQLHYTTFHSIKKECEEHLEARNKELKKVYKAFCKQTKITMYYYPKTSFKELRSVVLEKLSTRKNGGRNIKIKNFEKDIDSNVLVIVDGDPIAIDYLEIDFLMEHAYESKGQHDLGMNCNFNFLKDKLYQGRILTMPIGGAYAEFDTINLRITVKSAKTRFVEQRINNSENGKFFSKKILGIEYFGSQFLYYTTDKINKKGEDSYRVISHKGESVVSQFTNLEDVRFSFFA